MNPELVPLWAKYYTDNLSHPDILAEVDNAYELDPTLNHSPEMYVWAAGKLAVLKAMGGIEPPKGEQT